MKAMRLYTNNQISEFAYEYDCVFTGGVPPSRWIVNYDFDLLDGLVLGAVIGAHMPFLVSYRSFLAQDYCYLLKLMLIIIMCELKKGSISFLIQCHL